MRRLTLALLAASAFALPALAAGNIALQGQNPLGQSTDAFPRIVRLPLFHNSRTGSTLPPAFVESAQVLLRKFPAFAPIHTLCGTLDASFVARHTQAAA